MNTTSFQSILLLTLLVTGQVAIADDEPNANATTNSQSISVTVSSSTQDDGNNEPKSEVRGKIVIVGPDGVRKEFQLGDALPQGFDLNIDDFQNQIGLLMTPEEAQKPRPMIGVMSEPVSSLLRKHLKLGISGVVVTGLSADMPAAESGIVDGDIILKANGMNITNQNDLAVVVKESAGKEFDVELLHEGEKKTVKLLARITSPTEIPWPSLGRDPEHLNQLLFQGMGPGLQLQGNEDIEERVLQFMKKARKAAQDARRHPPHAEDLGRELSTLRERVSELEKQLRDAKSVAE